MSFSDQNNFLMRFLRWFGFKLFNYIKNRQQNASLKPSAEKRILLFPDLKQSTRRSELFRKIQFAFPLNRQFSFDYLYTESSQEEFQEQTRLDHFASHKLEPLRLLPLSFNKKPEYDKYHMILCHKASALVRIPSFFYKTEIVDPDFYSYTESLVFQRAYYHLLDNDQKNAFHDISRTNFQRMEIELGGRHVAWCFLTGPSISSYHNFQIDEKAIKIVCNSLVKDRKFLEFIQGPDIITFADPVFHFGASNYAIKFREHMKEAAMLWNSFIVVPDFTVPLLLAWFPELEHQIIGLHTTEGEFRLPDSHQLSVKATDNILTMFMLPLAASLASSIWVAGADGREKREKYFWKFSPEAQFNDEMESVFRLHPSFFRDRRYRRYYHKHCNTVEKFVSFIENHGKPVMSATPSYIPALLKRYQHQPHDT